jgi:tRNA (adenine22-N1)-methyltransferase
MMKQLKLSNRLQTVAEMLGEAAGVVDVGTDHGYLPAWLALCGTARRIVATDIREGPLRRARETAGEYGVSDRIEFIQTDGLDGVGADGLDTVILAGMGGETILRILEKAPWTRGRGVRCVLQPQTKTDLLTAWLARNGFRISDTALAEDDRRLYLIITAEAGETGAFREPLELLRTKRDPLLPRYLAGLLVKTRRALDGLERSKDRQEAEIGQLRAALGEFSRMKGETDEWQR